MGFIEIAAIDTPEELSRIWSDFIDMSKLLKNDGICTVQEKITDGMRVFLNKGQFLITVSDDKISDYIAGAGAFVFHSAFEPYKYTGKGGNSYNALCGEYSGMFGNYSENSVCYLINAHPQKRLPFEFSEAAYYDKNYGSDIHLQGSGYFEIGVSDALSGFIKAGMDCQKFEQTDMLNISDNESKNLSASFGLLFKSALSAMHEFDIGYDKLMYNGDKIISLVNSDPQLTQYLKNGAEISDIEFTSVFPNENSIEKILKSRRKNKVLVD